MEWLPNDGRMLTMPKLDPTMSCEYISIRSLAGNEVTIRPYSDKPMNIRTLRDGVYTLNSVDKHKVVRRIGQFIIRR